MPQGRHRPGGHRHHADWRLMDEPDFDNQLGTGFAVLTSQTQQVAAALHQLKPLFGRTAETGEQRLLAQSLHAQAWRQRRGGRSGRQGITVPRPMPTTAAEIAQLIVAEPPAVTVAGLDSRDEYPRGMKAVLLVWGTYKPRGWAAGIAWIFSKTRGSAIQALLTTWVPASTVQPWRNADYSQVPRIRLAGSVAQWPQLPAIMPRVDKRWAELHLHTERADPTGEYRHLRDKMRAFRR